VLRPLGGRFFFIYRKVSNFFLSFYQIELVSKQASQSEAAKTTGGNANKADTRIGWPTASNGAFFTRFLSSFADTNGRHHR